MAKELPKWSCEVTLSQKDVWRLPTSISSLVRMSPSKEISIPWGRPWKPHNHFGRHIVRPGKKWLIWRGWKCLWWFQGIPSWKCLKMEVWKETILGDRRPCLRLRGLDLCHHWISKEKMEFTPAATPSVLLLPVVLICFQWKSTDFVWLKPCLGHKPKGATQGPHPKTQHVLINLKINPSQLYVPTFEVNVVTWWWWPGWASGRQQKHRVWRVRKSSFDGYFFWKPLKGKALRGNLA